MELSLPSWVDLRALTGRTYTTDEEKMALAVFLSEQNRAEETGGPFGAAVFSEEDGSLISVGVNVVMPQNCSVAHAEMMAVMTAQKKLGLYRLDLTPLPRYTLATSAQPCAMCFGALPWTGIRRLLSGARREDVESLTIFDEGPLHPRWVEELDNRGIEVVQDLLRDEAAEVLRRFGKNRDRSY